VSVACVVRVDDQLTRLPDREINDDDDLVSLCEDRYDGLKAAFSLQGGASLKVRHLRSYLRVEGPRDEAQWP
jgi:hypothetical protein